MSSPEKAKVTPLHSGSLSLLVGIFKHRSQRTCTLWPHKFELSNPSSNKKSNNTTIVIPTLRAHVSDTESDTKFVLRDTDEGKNFSFVAASSEEKNMWISVIDRAIQSRHKARQVHLNRQKTRMNAIGDRLGVKDVVLGKKKIMPPALPETVEDKKLAITDAAAQDGEQDQVESGKELSQEIQKAAEACEVDADTLLQENQCHNANVHCGSGRGKTRLVDDVYWYTVQPNDTLPGICLYFDAKEASVRRHNFLAKRNIDGLQVLRIPRSCTAHPTKDYSGEGSHENAPWRNPEVAAKRFERQFELHTQIMVKISAQRALKTEDCFSEHEAKAYLALHDFNLDKALDAMEKDKEWDEKYGYIIRARWNQMAADRLANRPDTVHQLEVDSNIPQATLLPVSPNKKSSVAGQAIEMGTLAATQAELVVS